MEDNYYDELIAIYGANDIIRGYRDIRYSNNGYKFQCDFYIKSEDLFIECNFH